jgi:hypothetical protein
MAVGTFFNGISLAELWDGTGWSPETIPTPAGARGNGLAGVSCTSTTFCIVVGGYGTNVYPIGATFADEWNGTSWSIQTTPNPTGAQSSVLNGVSCTSTAACTAVGSTQAAGETVVRLAERYS